MNNLGFYDIKKRILDEAMFPLSHIFKDEDRKNHNGHKVVVFPASTNILCFIKLIYLMVTNFFPSCS